MQLEGHGDYNVSSLSPELFSLEIRGNPKLKPEEKEVIIQQYLNHQQQVQAHSDQLMNATSLRKELIGQYREIYKEEPDLSGSHNNPYYRQNAFDYFQRNEIKVVKSNLQQFWSGQAERIAGFGALVQRVQNAEITDSDKARLVDGLKREFNTLQKALAKAPEVFLVNGRKNQPTVGDLAALQNHYGSLLEEAKKDAQLLQKLENAKGLSPEQKQILKEGSELRETSFSKGPRFHKKLKSLSTFASTTYIWQIK